MKALHAALVLTCGASVAGACLPPFASKEQVLATSASAGGGTTAVSTTMSSSTGGSPCSDGVKDGHESDVDCGGDACAACALGRACNADIDCSSPPSPIHCVDGICSPPLKTFWAEKNIGSPPPPAPSPRQFGELAYDEASHSTLLFGGKPIPVGELPMWSWDGNQWGAIVLRGTDAAPPTYAGAMVYDAARERVLVIGGLNVADNQTPLAVTYEWDGEIMSPVGAATEVTPARDNFAAAYDRVAHQVVLFGGAAKPTTLNDTWIFDDSTRAWTKATPTMSPPAVFGAGAFYDEARDEIVLVGGYTGTAFGGTYIWKGATWTPNALASDAGCETRENMAIAYDSRRKRGVLYSGFHGGTGTCEWDGLKWTKMTPIGGPPSGGERNGAVMAFDRVRGSMFMTGVVDDIWEYHAIANGCRSDGDCDTGHCVDGLCCASASCGTCNACNVDATTAGTCAPRPSGALDPNCGAVATAREPVPPYEAALVLLERARRMHRDSIVYR